MLNYELLNTLVGDGQRKDFAEKTGLTQSYVSKIFDIGVHASDKISLFNMDI